MHKLYGVFLISMTCIIGLLILSMMAINDISRKNLCRYSVYGIPDYKIVDGNLFCRSSDNSFQLLTKHKARSSHLDDHKSEKDSD